MDGTANLSDQVGQAVDKSDTLTCPSISSEPSKKTVGGAVVSGSVSTNTTNSTTNSTTNKTSSAI